MSKLMILANPRAAATCSGVQPWRSLARSIAVASPHARYCCTSCCASAPSPCLATAWCSAAQPWLSLMSIACRTSHTNLLQLNVYEMRLRTHTCSLLQYIIIGFMPTHTTKDLS